jgi:hypothetical protein
LGCGRRPHCALCGQTLGHQKNERPTKRTLPVRRPEGPHRQHFNIYS